MSLSFPHRAGVALAYAGLLGVNMIFGSGAFGVPTNGELSAAYPTAVTPAGFTFAIWGPIFLLQGGGTCLIASGRAPAASAAVAPAWVLAWAAEVLWQFCFATLPVPASSGPPAARLAILTSALLCLLAAQAAMLVGAARLRRALLEDGRASPTAQLLLALPTAINAAWLAAASGIGLTLVAQQLSSPLATARGGAALLGAVVAGAGAAVLTLGRDRPTLALGAGYAAATAWACFGMTRGDAPPAVRAVASAGIWVAAASGALAAALAASRARAPPGDDAAEWLPGKHAPSDESPSAGSLI